MKSFLGNFNVMVRAYAYIRNLGAEGIADVSRYAVLNANYLRERIKDKYPCQYGADRPCMHEFVCSPGPELAAQGITATDVAKGLIDRGFHPPTTYFPLIVLEALMIEPTETEGKETLDAFAQALDDIAAQAASKPAELKDAPRSSVVGRMDETAAARKPVLHW
jgi:glycine dehydrogenase subunit 2